MADKELEVIKKAKELAKHTLILPVMRTDVRIVERVNEVKA